MNIIFCLIKTLMEYMIYLSHINFITLVRHDVDFHLMYLIFDVIVLSFDVIAA